MKRVLSCLMALLLIFGLLPQGAAQAAEGNERLSSLSVTADKWVLSLSEAVQLTATPLDGEGQPFAGTAHVTYTSINPYVATVNADGLVTALNAGVTKVIVTAQESENMVSEVVTITVLPAAEQSNPDILTFEDMEAGSAPETPGMPGFGILGSNLVSVSGTKGFDSAKSAYLDDTDTTLAYLNYRLLEKFTASKTLTLDFDVYLERGMVQFKILNGDHNNGNTAFWVRLMTTTNTGYYNGTAWTVPLVDRDGSVSIKADTWHHVHVEITNTSASEGVARIYIDGKFAGSALKSYGGASKYGEKTGGTLNSVYFLSSSSQSAVDSFYLDNIHLRPGIESLPPEDDSPVTIDLGGRIELAKNTEKIYNENGELWLGTDEYPNYIADYFQDGFGFCHIPANTFSPKGADYEKVFVPYYQNADVVMYHTVASVKIFDTDDIIDAAQTGGDIAGLATYDNGGLISKQDFMCNFVELPDGRYFATTYINYYREDGITADTVGWIYDPNAADGTDPWTRVDGVLHMDPDLPRRATRFTKTGILPDGTLVGTAYGGNGGCILLQSTDLGKTWTRRSTIIEINDTDEYYSPNGTRITVFHEPSFQVCPDGSLLVLLRVGNNLPLWQIRSYDNGLTWRAPEMLPGAGGVGSIYPCTVLLENGVLVASTGRPNTTVFFSLDGCGYKWDYVTTAYTDPSSTTPPYPSSGNASVTHIGPNTALVTGDYGFNETRASGIWGRVIEVTRNERSVVEIVDATLKAPSKRLTLGDTMDLFFAGIFDNNGRLIPENECTVKYYSESPEILTVDENTGRVSTVTYGPATVVAAVTYKGKTVLSGTFDILSVDVDRLAMLTLEPADWTLDPGQSTPANAVAANMIGTPLAEGVSISYQSADASIASVSATGVITGVAPGVTAITATAVKDGVTVSANTLIMVNSFLWEVSDFEEGVGGQEFSTLTEPFRIVAVPGDRTEYSTEQAYSGSTSLHLKDIDGARTPAIRREFSTRTAAVVEFMLYPAATHDGLAFGIGKAGTAGHTANSICWLQFRSPNAEGYMGVRAYSSVWSAVTETSMAVGQWNKVRLEAIADKRAKLYVNDQFVLEVPVRIAMDDLGVFAFYAGVNANTGDECYLDDLKVMTFDPAAAQTVALSDLSLGGNTVPGFSPDTLTYELSLPSDLQNAPVTAVAADPDASVTVGQSTDFALITVRKDNVMQEYTVRFQWQQPEAPAPWTAGESVTPGDIRSYGGVSYECLQAHTTLASWVPSLTPALWRVYRAPGEISDWQQPTGSHDAYGMGELVRYQGSVYESLLSANVWSPSAYPAGWQRLPDR